MNDFVISRITDDLESFTISNKYIKNEDWEKINNFIFQNTNIINACFSGISITDYGLKQLSEVVKSNENLKELQLDWNNFTELSSEFDYLCEGLIQSNISTVLLNNNKISSHLCHSICKLIKHSDNLTILDLRWNDIGDDGAKLILETLKKNTNLQVINLIGNKITNQGLIKEIDDLLDRNKQFQENLGKTGSSFNKKKSNFY